MALPTPETPATIDVPVEIVDEDAAAVAAPTSITALAAAVIPVPGA